MFSIKKTNGTPLVKSQERFDTLIGRQTEIHGSLRVVQSVRIDGKVIGNIDAHERVELHASALVQGDVKYGSIAVEHGARLLGLLLQVDASQTKAQPDHAKNAIRKAQATGATE
jgi:cytoskeletal protein CcmA (bactofilin family)